MRRILKFGGVLICLLLLVAFFCFVGLCIWAIGGPRDISQYVDYVENSINRAMPNNHIKIDKTYIEWGGLDELMSIKTTNIEIYNKSGQRIAALPEVVLKYGLTSLITGHIIPSELKLVAPRIDLSDIMHKGAGGGLSLQDFNLNRLNKVSIVHAVLVAPDKSEWNLPSAVLWYNDGGILINASINRPDQAVQLSVRTNMTQSDNLIKASFTNLDTDSLAFYLPEIAPVHFKVSGHASFTANAKNRIAAFNIDNFTGEYDDANIFKYKLAVRSGQVAGSYDLNRKILDLQKIAVEFTDYFRFGGKAKIINFNDYDVTANLSNLKTGNIKNYWPAMVAPNGLRWTAEHLSGGEVSEGTLTLKIKPEDLQAPKLPREDVNLKFSFNGVSASYMNNFAPVTNGAGTGVLDGDGLKVHVASANLNNSAITNTDVSLNALGTPGENLTLNGHIQGPLEDLAEFYIKLSKGQKLFADKSDIGGNAVSEIGIKLPLKDALKLDDVLYNVKTQGAEAVVKNFYGLFGVERLTLDLAANNSSYNIKGQCLASYGSKDTKFSLNKAPLGFEVTGKSGQMRLAFASDITNSTLEFSPLEIKKPAGEQGKLIAEIQDDGVHNPLIKQFSLESKSIKAVAQGTLKRDYSGFANLDISTLQFGKTNLAARILSDPYLTAEFKGPYFDAAPAIRYLKKDRGSQDDSQFKILMKADEIGMLNDKYLKGAYVTLQCGKNCDVISINASGLSFNQAGGKLKVKTDNAGYVLDGFDLYSNMVGGKLDIDAKVNGGDYDGKISITDFSIVKAKVLARMLTIGSLTGIADIVQGKGITFKKLDSNVQMSKHQVTVTDYRMVGAAIGITAKGSINRDKYTADISGNIIPAYTANTLLGEIPLIGPAIIGDEGVFALAYHLTGNVDDPQMNINPLSVLAPGFLKDVFK